MSGVLQQIKASYEVNNMTVEEIADDQKLDITAIKAGLMQVSAQYRKDCKLEPEEVDDLNFSKDQLREVNRVIFELATSAEDEHLRAKMATYVRDDVKGRKDVVKQMGNSTINILQFNEQIARIRDAAKAMKQKLIEV